MVHAVVSILGKVLDLHARCRDVLRLDTQNPLDDAVALLPGLLSCTRNEFIRSKRVHLTRQIRILSQAPAEIRNNLGHAFYADLAPLGLYHAVQFKLHSFLVCHAVYLPLPVCSERVTDKIEPVRLV